MSRKNSEMTSFLRQQNRKDVDRLVSRNSQRKLLFPSTECMGREKHAFLEEEYILWILRFLFFSSGVFLCVSTLANSRMYLLFLMPHALQKV